MPYLWAVLCHWHISDLETGRAMNIQDRINQILLYDTRLEKAETDIYSVIPKNEQAHHYDKAAKAYDWVIGNHFYNRIIWGNWPSQYEKFCKQALASNTNGIVLDAGCGSLIFTAKAYAKSKRPIVLLDRSLGMLKRARNRLVQCEGKVPENIILIQADILHMPFLQDSFSTVQSFGMLHLFENTEVILNELMRVKNNDGNIFLSCLAANNKLGNKYLQFLKTQHEVALCQSSELLHQRLIKEGIEFEVCSVGNMAYFTHCRQHA
ncbi:MAG: class I SAM-dependent methyltransferase [Mariprofundaceae bacterium]